MVDDLSFESDCQILCSFPNYLFRLLSPFTLSLIQSEMNTINVSLSSWALLHVFTAMKMQGSKDKLRKMTKNNSGECGCILSGQICPNWSQYQLIQYDLSKSFSCLTFERLARWPLHQSQRQMVQFVSAKFLPSLVLHRCCLLSSHQPDG